MKHPSTLLSIILLCFFLAGCFPSGELDPIDLSVPDDDVEGALPENAAIVNGTPITSEAFQKEYLRFKEAENELGLLFPNSESRVLNLLIEEELIRQKATSQGLNIETGAIDGEINGIIDEMGSEYLDNWLVRNNYSIDEFRALIEVNLLTEKLTEPIVAEIPFTSPHVHAQHILVNTEGEAQEVLDRLSEGETFESLAAEYSLDVTTRNHGGDLGWFPRGALFVIEVEEAAFSMNSGELSGIIQSDWGFHIVQTLEKVDNQEIDEDVRQRMIASALDHWRESLKEGADIQILLDFN